MRGRKSQVPRSGEAEKDGTTSPLTATPRELVHQLSRMIDAEVADITFDYFALHDICWALHKDLKVSLDSLICDDSARFIPQEDKHPFLVGFAFSTASSNLDFDWYTVPNRALLEKSAELVRDMLASGRGRAIMDEMKAYKHINPEETVTLDCGSLNTDRWHLKSGKLFDFVTESAASQGGAPQ